MVGWSKVDDRIVTAWQGAPMDLTPIEFRLLKALADAKALAELTVSLKELQQQEPPAASNKSDFYLSARRSRIRYVTKPLQNI